jgi:hypothetical protein
MEMQPGLRTPSSDPTAHWTATADDARRDPWLARHDAAMTELLRIPGVVRVGLGLRESSGELVHEWVYRVYVRSRRARRGLWSWERIPAEVRGIRTDVLVDGRTRVRPESKTPTLAPGSSIVLQKVVTGASLENGSVGLLVRRGYQDTEGKKLGEGKFILTNEHVLYAPVPVGHPTLRQSVYSPQPGSCRDPAASTDGALEPLSKKDYVAFGGTSCYVDAALALIEKGVGGANEHKDLAVAGNPAGKIQTTLHDLLALALPPGGSAPVVRKRGATTGLTRGTVVEVAFKRAGATAITSQLRIRPDPAAAVDYSKEVTFAASQDLAEVTQAFAGAPVTAVPVPGHPRRFKLSGKVFGDSGDSGSCVVDDVNRPVGLYYGSEVRPVTVVEDGKDVPASLKTGYGEAAHIRPVFAAMGLDEATGIIPPVTPSAGAAIAVPDELAAEWSAHPTGVAALDDVLARTPAGRRLRDLAARHADEVAHLVHHRRRVMVTWHRSRGPAFAAVFLRALRGGDARLPAEIDGVRLTETLAGMRVALLAEGDPALRDAVLAHGDALLALAERAGSVPELVQALASMDERCFRS